MGLLHHPAWETTLLIRGDMCNVHRGDKKSPRVIAAKKGKKESESPRGNQSTNQSDSGGDEGEGRRDLGLGSPALMIAAAQRCCVSRRSVRCARSLWSAKQMVRASSAA